MFCQNELSHTIAKGDNLYHLANVYGTSVPEILTFNPNIDPYNLQPGSSIVICAPHEVSAPHTGNPGSIPAEQLNLSDRMRLAWEQHVYWTRMLLISIAQKLNDQGDVTVNLLKNPQDIANIFLDYYSPSDTEEIARLLTEHLEIGASLITALRDGQTALANRLNMKWYINADKIARELNKINPFFDYKTWQEMLYDHLNLTKKEVAMRLAGSYTADIEAFNAVEAEVLKMSDALTHGIMLQFPDRFVY
jgi:LysM repeat protein